MPASFRLLLTSLAVSSCGDWLYNVALLAFVYGANGLSHLAGANHCGPACCRSSSSARSAACSPTATTAAA